MEKFIYKIQLIIDRFSLWLWWQKGWPSSKRCPLCAGMKTRDLGKHGTSYVVKCDLCIGTGYVRRNY